MLYHMFIILFNRTGTLFQSNNSSRLSWFMWPTTHSKLIVGVHRSFPHRSGIVETLHVVGFVEAAGGVR